MHLLAPLFTAFQVQYTDIHLDVVLGNPALNLSRRDADVAIRATDTPPDTLVGRRVGRIAWALYGRAADHPPGADRPDADALGRCNWVALGDSMGPMAVVQVAVRDIDPRHLRLRCNSVLGLAEAVEAGIGIGHLPCFIGDARPALTRLGDPVPAFSADLWLLTHPDLRQSPRIKVFMETIGAGLAGLRGRLEGRLRPSAGLPIEHLP